MQYTAKITKKGQITIPVELRRSRDWTDGSRLIFSIDPDTNVVEEHKAINLYDTEWGKYDFKNAVKKESQLKMGDYNVGREGWEGKHE